MSTTIPYENPDLKRERQNCSFNREEITHLIDGGPEKTKDRQEFEAFLLSDPDLKDSVPYEYLSHVDRYTSAMKKSSIITKKMREYARSKNIPLNSEWRPEASNLTEEGNPLNIQYAMFIPTLEGQATAEQQAKWLTRAYNHEIVGTYAQTELGHGTFIRGLETKATYDPSREEFLLETPSINAYKWWPGGLGHSVNYAVVMAQLYTKGKNEGPHLFLVQLRDEETHEPLPGITIGEIGPKLGLNSLNQGYLAFNKVWISRDQLLMKNAKVLEDGSYVKSKNSKLSYATMVFVRVLIAMDMSFLLRKASTIAIRYSCVRHQSELEPGAPEPQIIEYQAQQNKLFPPLAASFAFHFAAARLSKLYEAATENIKKGDLQLLPDLHGLSCSLKALTTSEAAYYIETLRQSCGGHGYMASSSFPRIYGLCTASETYEGENTVMWLQVARYVVKTYTDKSGGASVAYLIHPQKNINPADVSLDALVIYFQKVAIGLVDQATKELESGVKSGLAFHDAWNNSAVSLIKAAQSHARYSVVDAFVAGVKEGNFSTPVRRILSQLCELFLIYWVMERSGDFILHAGLNKEQMSLLQSNYVELLAAIRPQALNVVDSFDIRDEILNSALGCWDGNAYQRLFDQAAKSPLNQTAVHKESFEKYLKPLMNSKL